MARKWSLWTKQFAYRAYQGLRLCGRTNRRKNQNKTKLNENKLNDKLFIRHMFCFSVVVFMRHHRCHRPGEFCVVFP